jgi:cobalt-zinc-cadmium resistance protein CzcA
MRRLALEVPSSLLLIFVPLFDAFSLLKKAILVLINVPLALIGGFVTLWVFEVPLAVSVASGSVVLSGQAVLKGVVILSPFHRLEAAGVRAVDTVHAGRLQRLRTVPINAPLAAIGLLPVALSRDIGAKIRWAARVRGNRRPGERHAFYSDCTLGTLCVMVYTG